MEKIIGVGVERSEAKSRCETGGGRGVGVFSDSPMTFSVSKEDTERRFVRAGVLIVAGGALDPPEADHEMGRALIDALLVSKSSDCLEREESDPFRRIVDVLRFWWIERLFSTLSKGSRSGVVGAEDSISRGADGDEVEPAEDSESLRSRCGVEGESGSYVSSFVVNQACARICGIVYRLETSFCKMFCSKSRDSANIELEHQLGCTRLPTHLKKASLGPQNRRE